MRQKGRLFGQVHVHRIRDAEASPASVEQLLKLIASKARPSDVFMMYASGHGGMVRCEGESKPGYRLLTYRASFRAIERCARGDCDGSTDAQDACRQSQQKLLLLDSYNRAQRRVETCCLR